ncbi:MAG: tetratricopeptide repeat protein [Desulfarculaceae bacterium]|nr:tetratricopeptide repeat protein [Desulfarculaceae bacterium]
MLKHLVGLLLLILTAAALAASCGGKKAAPVEGQTSTNEQPAAAAAEQAEPICLYLFWSRDPVKIGQVRERMAGGEAFPLAAKAVSEEGLKGASRLNATCMQPAELEPELLVQGERLSVGQVGAPFDYAQGQALAMRTTDRHWRRGKEFYAQKQYVEAAQALRRHLELHPDAATVWQALADCLSAQGNDQAALEALDRALAVTPESPSLLNDRATALMRLGRGPEALADYRQALQLAPGNALLTHNLAWALLKQSDNLDLALTLAQQAVRVDPGNSHFWDTLGQIHKKRGEYGEAVVSLYRAHHLGAKQKDTRQDLAEALLELPPEAVSRLAVSKGSLPPLPAGASAAAPGKTAKPVPLGLPAASAGQAPLLRRESTAAPPAAPAGPEPPSQVQPAPQQPLVPQWSAPPLAPHPAQAAAPAPPPVPAERPAGEEQPLSQKVYPPPPLWDSKQYRGRLEPVEEEVLLFGRVEAMETDTPQDQEEDDFEPPAPPAAQAAAPDKPRPRSRGAVITAELRKAPSPAARIRQKLPAPLPGIPGYYILVASFRYPQLAAKEMSRWRRRKQAVWMEWKLVPGRGDWVRVMLGPYQKEAVARTEAEALQARRLINGYRVLDKRQ